MYLMVGLDRDIGRCIGRYIGRDSIEYRSILGRYSTDISVDDCPRNDPDGVGRRIDRDIIGGISVNYMHR